MPGLKKSFVFRENDTFVYINIFVSFVSLPVSYSCDIILSVAEFFLTVHVIAIDLNIILTTEQLIHKCLYKGLWPIIS